MPKKGAPAGGEATLHQAIEIALVKHPSVIAALHQADAAKSAVEVSESALTPTMSVSA